jgi:MFS family permease
MISALVYSQWSTTFPLFLNTVEGVPYWLLGVALAVNGIIVIFGQTTTTRMMLGRKHTAAAALALVLFAMAFVALGAFSLLGLGVLVAAFAFVVLLTIGENLGAIPMMTLPSNLAPKSERGSYNGAFNTLSGIGGIFAPLAGGLALSASGNPLVVWGALAIPTIPAVLIFLWLGKRIPATANTV